MAVVLIKGLIESVLAKGSLGTNPTETSRSRPRYRGGGAIISRRTLGKLFCQAMNARLGVRSHECPLFPSAGPRGADARRAAAAATRAHGRADAAGRSVGSQSIAAGRAGQGVGAVAGFAHPREAWYVREWMYTRSYRIRIAHT
eukprot:scaffold478_cov409-Prasinococcus_capsulatus_cf.AAC.14